MQTKIEKKTEENKIMAWIFRLFKGMVIGTGFIIPGVSGGVFAAIFGVYERMIAFFANIRKDFIKNVFFFLPIGIGGIISIVLVAGILDSFLELAETQLIYFFIGCVIGTLPALFKQAGKEGRSSSHYIILAVTASGFYLFLFYIESILNTVSIPTNSPFTWLLSGALMGLGAIVPGLSPSNFLIYLKIYDSMIAGMKDFKLIVFIPVLLGAGLCFILLSKTFDWLFKKAYSVMYHIILGVIIASTMKIIPIGADKYGTAGIILVCAAALIIGIALGYIMGLLEKKYKED